MDNNIQWCSTLMAYNAVTVYTSRTSIIHTTTFAQKGSGAKCSVLLSIHCRNILRTLTYIHGILEHKVRSILDYIEIIK